MAGGNHREVEGFGDRPILDPQSDPFCGRLQVADPAGLIDPDVKALFPGLDDQAKELVAKVFAQQDARQKLAIVQRLIIDAIARKVRPALGLQPVEIGALQRRDFNTGDIGQHHARVFFIAIGHAHARFLSLFVNGHVQRFTAFKE